MKCSRCNQEFEKDAKGSQVITAENEELALCPSCFTSLQEAYRYVQTPAGRAEVRKRQRHAEKRRRKRTTHGVGTCLESPAHSHKEKV